MHGVEVCHSPYVLATGLIQIFPPCRRCPVAWTTVSAAQPTLAFPWLGLWNSRGVVLPPDAAPNEAWDYYYRHQERMDLLLVAAYTTFTSASDVVPQELYALQLRCSAGDAGQLGLGEFFHQWRTWLRAWAAEGSCHLLSSRTFTQGLPGGLGQPGDKKELEHIGRFAAGWRAIVNSGTFQLGTACIDCGDPTRRVCWSCAW